MQPETAKAAEGSTPAMRNEVRPSLRRKSFTVRMVAERPAPAGNCCGLTGVGKCPSLWRVIRRREGVVLGLAKADSSMNRLAECEPTPSSWREVCTAGNGRGELRRKSRFDPHHPAGRGTVALVAVGFRGREGCSKTGRCRRLPWTA